MVKFRGIYGETGYSGLFCVPVLLSCEGEEKKGLFRRRPASFGFRAG